MFRQAHYLFLYGSPLSPCSLDGSEWRAKNSPLNYHNLFPALHLTHFNCVFSLLPPSYLRVLSLGLWSGVSYSSILRPGKQHCSAVHIVLLERPLQCRPVTWTMVAVDLAGRTSYVNIVCVQNYNRLSSVSSPIVEGVAQHGPALSPSKAKISQLATGMMANTSTMPRRMPQR